MQKWAIDFIKWCDDNEIEVPRTEQGLLELKVFEAKNKRLTCIHPNIIYLNKLGRLNVENNMLRELPTLPKNLVTLIAKNNLFSEIPQNIRGLKYFSHLLIAGNMIEEIPSWTEEIERLTTLDLKNNKLKTIRGVENNKNLKILLVASNAIEDISPIYGLENLEIFDFYDNKVKVFDKRIRKLKKLDIFTGFENSIEDFDLLYLMTNKKTEIRVELMDSFKFRLYRAWVFFKNILKRKKQKATKSHYFFLK